MAIAGWVVPATSIEKAHTLTLESVGFSSAAFVVRTSWLGLSGDLGSSFVPCDCECQNCEYTNCESRQEWGEVGFDQGLLSGYQDLGIGMFVMPGEKSPRDTKGIKSVLKSERGQRRKLEARTITSLGKVNSGI
jgi:hypothetical protein